MRGIVLLFAIAACSSDGSGSSPDSGGSGDSGGGGNSTASCKRGVAYGHHSEADLRALSAGISWWYNWTVAPDDGVRDAYEAIGVEYVPMVWGHDGDTAAAQANAPADSKVLLGFNEPNFGGQADLTAGEAAARWPDVEAVADARDMKLLSPAVNFCGGDCNGTDPFAYLDDFFAACVGCRVDAIAVHIYVSCDGQNGNHAQWMINHLETYKQRFTQPIWLTEFACDNAASDADQLAFMQDALTYLEAEPRIERYAWFSGRADNVPHVDLLGASGELTTLGHEYVEHAGAGCDRGR